MPATQKVTVEGRSSYFTLRLAKISQKEHLVGAILTKTNNYFKADNFRCAARFLHAAARSVLKGLHFMCYDVLSKFLYTSLVHSSPVSVVSPAHNYLQLSFFLTVQFKNKIVYV